MEDFEITPDYLTVASDNIKKAKNRLTKFVDKIYSNVPISILEFDEYIRDYIQSTKRQNILLDVIFSLSKMQNTTSPVIPDEIKNLVVMVFNTEFQLNLKSNNVFYFLNASKSSFEIDFPAFSEDSEFTEFVLNNPAIIEIYGQRGNGKTDFSTYLMKYFHDLDNDAIILTNIIFEDQPDYIINIFSDYELLEQLTKEGNKYIFIDEAGIQFTTFNSTMSSENKFLHMFLPLSRKFKTKLFFIYQISRYTNYSLSSFTDVIIDKLNKNTAKFILFPGQKNKKTIYYSTEPSSLKFDTNAIAYFDTYFNLKKLYNLMGQVRYVEAIEILREMLSNPDEVKEYVHKKKQKDFMTKYFPEYIEPEKPKTEKKKRGRPKGSKNKKKTVPKPTN